MEQMTMQLDNEARKEKVINAITKEFDNPDHEKYLRVITNKDGSISIWAKSALAAKIIIRQNLAQIEIRNKHIQTFLDCSESLSGLQFSKKNNSDWASLTIKDFDDVISFSRPISAVYVSVLSELGGVSFACCSRYEQCSDAKKCVNPNFMMALSCAYKKNLEAGRIFYGKNKTI